MNRWITALIIVASVTAAHADERLFGYTYETTTMPAGSWEYEQWVTWKTSKKSDSDFDRLDFRHELEYGVTDKFQIALYMADWRFEDGEGSDQDTITYRDTAVEAIYSLTDPVTDPIGVALYGEVAGGPELLKVEAKLLLQKNIGQFTFAWNGILEAEWEGDRYHEDIGELGQTFGASYQLHPSFSVGGELVHEIEYEDWEEWGDHVVYAGPNASYRANRWWITVTPLFQVTDVDGEADFQTRFLIGVGF